MVKRRDRVIAMFLAGLFLLTSSALTIGVIYQIVQDNNKKPADDMSNLPPEVAQQLKQQKEKNMQNPTKLQGTPLAGFTPMATIDKLQVADSTPGTGATVKAGDTITADYTGAVAATGIVFQSSKDTGQPASFSLSEVIAGWSQGVPGMKVGGTRRLLIPANLAYGPSPPSGSGIPANADLVFDVTVHKIGK